MTFTPDLANSVRAAGGALWFLLGGWLALRRREQREARLLAIYFCAIAVDFVGLNLLGMEKPIVAGDVVAVSWLTTATNLIAIASLGALLRGRARSEGDRDAWSAFALGSAFAVGLAVAAIYAALQQPSGGRFLPPGDSAVIDRAADAACTATEYAAHAMLGAVCFLWARRAARGGPEGAGLAWLAASGALFVAAYADVGLNRQHGNLRLFGFAIGLQLTVLVFIVTLAMARPAVGARATRLAIAVPLIAAVLLLADERSPTDIGARGIARALAFAGFVVAFSRYGLFAREGAATGVSRAATATLALATLIVTAQVAQNFFAAEYGLLTGGVVAGAFLFAAKPLERALEGRNAARRGPSSPDDRARRIYRDAVRHSLRDRVMSRAEEIHLTELAEELGIPASDALRLRHEVEDELTARG